MGDFLVVEDPEKVTTWHLPVKVNGTPDRGLAGAAWAALFSASGYRGNKYSGPKSDEAKRKLKALYSSQDWEMPVSEAEIETAANLAEYYEPMSYVPFGVTSFAALDQMEEQREMSRALSRRVDQFQSMIYNVWNNSEISDKVQAWNDLFGEFISIMQDEFTEPKLVEMSETSSGSVSSVNLSESDTTSDNGPLYMTVRLIRPGLGNKKDNNYYPKEMLQRSAPLKFPGVKMHVTDHRDEERSVRTEVSQIVAIEDFDDDGAPLAKVVTLDPGFAEMVRHRAKSNKLDSLECSIYGVGKAIKKVIGGKEVNEVQEFDEIYFVDWVTRAGAGGKALSITEFQENEKMTKQPEENENTQENLEEKELVAPVMPVTINESDSEEEITEENDNLESQSETETQETQETQEPPATAGILSRADVLSVLESDSREIHPLMRERLLSIPYHSQEDVIATVNAEFDYLSNLNGSGRVFGMGEDEEEFSEQDSEPDPVTLSEAATEINSVWGFGKKKN